MSDNVGPDFWWQCKSATARCLVSESGGPTGPNTKSQTSKSKHQTPSSKLQKNFKSQAPRRRRRGQNWDLELRNSLVFGTWCLVFSSCLSGCLFQGLRQAIDGVSFGFNRRLESQSCQRLAGFGSDGGGVDLRKFLQQ